MKKKLALALAAVMVMSLALAGCGGEKKPAASSTPAPSGSSAATSEPAGLGPKDGGTNLTFTTGGETGTYYGFGNVIANKVGDLTSTSVKAITSGGSAANIQALEDGDAQLGFVQSDVMVYAYNGERTFAETGASTGFSTVANLYMEQVQIVTMNPDIKTVEDLRGKSVSIGALGSGVYFNAVDVLGCYDMTIDDIAPVYQSFGDSADSLKDGKIDAAFIVAGAPTTAITDLSTSGQVYLVSIDDEHVDKLIAASPYYSKYTVSADTYGMPEDAQTVAVAAMVLARNDVSEDAIYTFVSTIFDNADQLQHGKAAELSLEFASSISSVPYHPGAARYFAEKGFDVA